MAPPSLLSLPFDIKLLLVEECARLSFSSLLSLAATAKVFREIYKCNERHLLKISAREGIGEKEHLGALLVLQLTRSRIASLEPLLAHNFNERKSAYADEVLLEIAAEITANTPEYYFNLETVREMHHIHDYLVKVASRKLGARKSHVDWRDYLNIFVYFSVRAGKYSDEEVFDAMVAYLGPDARSLLDTTEPQYYMSRFSEIWEEEIENVIPDCHRMCADVISKSTSYEMFVLVLILFHADGEVKRWMIEWLRMPCDGVSDSDEEDESELCSAEE